MTDRLITSIPLIERYSRHNEREDMRFRDYLKHRLNLSNSALDAIVSEEGDAVCEQIDCTACAHCCKTMRPSVDNADAKRLAAHLAMSPAAFSRKYLTKDEFGEQVMAQKPCPFLGGDNKCTIYEIRPQACRDFPYLHKENFRSRSLTMLGNVSACPIVFNVWQALKRRFGHGGHARPRRIPRT